MEQRRRPLLKVIILGDSSVGKTSLLNQFVKKKFDSSYKATIGADFYTKDVDVDGKVYTLQIWDTVGQERFQSMGISFYRGADCVVLVYDVRVAETYHNLGMWRDEFMTHGAPSNPGKFPFVVIGNKIDLDGNKIKCPDPVQDLLLSEDHVSWFLTSAKDGRNVEEAFAMVAKMALDESEKDHDILNSKSESVHSLTEATGNSFKKKCSC